MRFIVLLSLLTSSIAYAQPASQPASRPASQPAHEGHDQVAHYTCPMHPSVKSAEPGKCPICGMPLTPVKQSELETGTVVIDSATRKNVGIRTAEVTVQPITRELRAFGDVAYDEARLFDVAPRVHGWVVALAARVSGQRVSRGQVLCTLYSPDVYAAELQLLDVLARGADRRSLATFERKLSLLGVAQRDIEALKKRRTPHEAIPIRAPASGFVIDKNIVEGTHADAGTRLFRVAALDSVWLEARLFEEDASLVAVGQEVKVELAHVAGPAATGRVVQVLPYLDGATRSVVARVALDNPDGHYKPGMYADATFSIPVGEVLQVPEDAVLFAGRTRLVFVERDGDRLTPVEVTTGLRANGRIEIREGLKPGDRVVVSGNFLVAAESRLRSAARYWSDE
ncbi:MAG: efflux RND transporter periplasmic adaptor subunit [Deltaproteobacteria bacterium]|jgi:Cu(I)/Ag(I) efflux system membrane fusion protein